MIRPDSFIFLYDKNFSKSIILGLIKKLYVYVTSFNLKLLLSFQLLFIRRYTCCSSTKIESFPKG